MVVLGPAGLGLEPLPPQPETVGECVQLLQAVGLQVPAAGPPSPVAGRERVVHVDAQLESQLR